MFSPDMTTRIEEIVSHAIDETQIPGAVIAAGVGQETFFEKAFGYAENYQNINRRMNMDTIFDLASLTKVVATLPCVLHLVDSGRLRLQDPVSNWIPEFLDGHKARVTVYHLLTHTSGLPAERTYHREWNTSQEILNRACAEPLEVEPGIKVNYSDVGFMLLGEIVQRESGMSVSSYASQFIYKPAGMPETQYCPNPSLRYRIAATEVLEGKSKVGIVHDENAEALNGIAGHAGLFSTAADIETYIKMWLKSGKSALSIPIRKLAVSSHTWGQMSGNRGLGWVRRHDSYDHTGDLWPESTVGHTGYTGTSLAFDPVSELWLVLLTNRVHYGRHKNISRLRALIHNVVAASV